MIVAGLISLTLSVLYILNISYLYSLEQKGCECAMDYRRVYIMAFTAVFLVYSLLLNWIAPKIIINYIHYILPVMMVGGIVNVIFTLQYVAKLKVTECKCSESVYRDIMETLAIINAVTYGIVFLMALASIEVLSRTGGSILSKVSRVKSR
jgi:hypothetical protein|uniref:MARVEL domain-containing protein n=1 Tax=viral metagenome TaxID=1070528 RepID=A0A6C0DFQ8_9ZZZZ